MEKQPIKYEIVYIPSLMRMFLPVYALTSVLLDMS